MNDSIGAAIASSGWSGSAGRVSWLSTSNACAGSPEGVAHGSVAMAMVATIWQIAYSSDRPSGGVSPASRSTSVDHSRASAS